jgi:hypothetical protein
MLGKPRMPWQRYVDYVANEVDPVTGWWAYDEVVIFVPRQAGKTTELMPIRVHRLGALRNGSLWMTAQSGTKALKRWNDFRETLEASAMAHRVKSWVSIGHERTKYLSTGSHLYPFAPTGEFMHGESPDHVDADEWWAFDAAEAQALVSSYSPGFLTKNAQAWKMSTAGTEESTALAASVKQGRAAVEMDRRTGTAYFEWSLPDEVDGVPVEELTDAQLVEACIAIHPAIGFHPTTPAEKMRHHIRSELDPGVKLDRAEFIRAYGNRSHGSSAGWKQVGEPEWAAAMSQRPIPKNREVPVGFGFAIHPEGRDAAIAAAWRGPDGRAIVELLKFVPGSHWVLDAMGRLTDTWEVVQSAVNNVGPSRDLADKLEASGIELLRISQADYAAACARVKSELTVKPRPTLLHIGQAELTTAMQYVGRRRMGAGGSWAWAADVDVSITPVEAMTAALWAVDHPREQEPDPGRFWMR